jgi:hypothetical protein
MGITRKTTSVLWAVLVGIGIIALAGSVMLPSTKRARVGVEELHRLSEERRLAMEAEEAAKAATVPATTTTAATAPTTQPLTVE